MPEGVTEYRTTAAQRRGLLKWTIIIFAATVVAGFIGQFSGFAGILAAGYGLCFLGYLYLYFAYRGTWTRFGPEGISGRGLVFRFEYRWDQVYDIASRAVAGDRGSVRRSVVLTTTDGDRIRLGTPVSGQVMGDPDFRSKYALICDTWQAATRRAPALREARSVYTRWVLLLTPAIAAQIALFIYAVSRAPRSPADMPGQPLWIAAVLLAAEIAVPVARNHRRRRRARVGLAAAAGGAPS